MSEQALKGSRRSLPVDETCRLAQIAALRTLAVSPRTVRRSCAQESQVARGGPSPMKWKAKETNEGL